jgi:hypothetical protein
VPVRSGDHADLDGELVGHRRRQFVVCVKNVAGLLPGIHDHARRHRRDRMQPDPHRGDHAEVSAAAA